MRFFITARPYPTIGICAAFSIMSPQSFVGKHIPTVGSTPAPARGVAGATGLGYGPMQETVGGSGADSAAGLATQ